MSGTVVAAPDVGSAALLARSTAGARPGGVGAGGRSLRSPVRFAFDGNPNTSWLRG